MKRIVNIVLLLLAVLPICAQTEYGYEYLDGSADVLVVEEDTMPHHPDIMADMSENVTIHHSEAVASLLESMITGVGLTPVEMDGYRVQVFSSNNAKTAKADAFAMEAKVLEANLLVGTYVQYTQPFWKVRLGDFLTREDANLLKDEILRHFPELKGDTYVVRDKVTVMK